MYERGVAMLRFHMATLGMTTCGGWCGIREDTVWRAVLLPSHCASVRSLVLSAPCGAHAGARQEGGSVREKPADVSSQKRNEATLPPESAQF